MKKWIVILVAMAAFSQLSYAQISSMNGFRKNFATVMFAGLGGAILGLSTLSFYGTPQDHIGNIWTGLSLGVIAGTGYVVTNATAKPISPTDPYTLIDSAKHKTAHNQISLPIYLADF